MTPPVGARPELRSQVEPRLVERRRAVDLASRRRRIRRRVAAAAAVAVVLAVPAVAFSPVADLDRVVVTGDTELADDEVARIAGLERGVALVAVDPAAARSRLRAHPSVAAARVEREWPGTVRVSILDERPVAEVAVGDAARVVARSGRVLRGAPAAELPLVELDGVEVPAEGEWLDGPPRRVIALLGDLRPALAQRIVGVRLDPDGELELRLGDDATVRFGPLEDVPAKLLAIETVFERVVPDCLAELDVREPTRPAIGRRGGCALAEPTEPSDAPSVEPGGPDDAEDLSDTGAPAADGEPA